MGQRWTLDDANKINNFVEFVTQAMQAGKPQTVEFIKPGRTLNQNSMVHALYGDIAKQRDDLTVLDVERHCKLYYGVPILRANNAEFRQMWDARLLGDRMSTEGKLDIVTYMDISSRMSKEECSEYISTILNEYQKQGFYLPDPRQEEVR